MDGMLTQEELNKIFSEVDPYKEERDSTEQFDTKENKDNMENQISTKEQEVNGNKDDNIETSIIVVNNSEENNYVTYEEYLEEVKKVLFENYGREVPNSILNEFVKEVEKNDIDFESKEHVIDLFESFGYAKKYGFSKNVVDEVPIEILEPDDKAYSQFSQKKTKFDFDSHLKEILRAKYGSGVSDEVIAYFEKFGYAELNSHKDSSKTSKESTSSNEEEKKFKSEQKKEEKDKNEKDFFINEEFRMISENSEKVAGQILEEERFFSCPNVDSSLSMTDYYSDLTIALEEIGRSIFFLEEEAKKATHLSDIMFDVFELNKLINGQYFDEKNTNIQEDLFSSSEEIQEMTDTSKKNKKVKKVRKTKKKFNLKNKILFFAQKNNKIIEEDFIFEFENSEVDIVRSSIRKFLQYNNAVLSEEEYQRFFDDVSYAISNGQIENNEEAIITYFISNGYNYEFEPSGRNM